MDKCLLPDKKRIFSYYNAIMKAVLLYVFAGVLTTSAIGQERMSLDGSKQPYLIVDSLSADLKYLVLSPDKIESINILKDGNAVASYGDKAKYGVIIIKTKPNTTLLRIGEILDRFEISKADRELRVCINKALVSRQELVLIEASEITGVDITTDRYWINPNEANSNERFINISTKEKRAL